VKTNDLMITKIST